MQFLRRWQPQIFALFRIITGLLFACHGSQKLFAFPGPMQGGGGGGHLPPLMMVGAVIELAGGLMIAIGLFSSFAAFICSGEMAVAYFMVHAKSGFWPILNHGEPAVLFCFAFLYIAAHGPGVWAASKK